MDYDLEDAKAEIQRLRNDVDRLMSGSMLESASVDRGRVRIGDAEFRVDGDGLFSLVGQFNQSGKYTMYSGADFEVRSGGTLTLDGLLRVLSGGRLTLQGILEVLSGGGLAVKSGGGITVDRGGKIGLNGDIDVASDGSINVGTGGQVKINGPIPIYLRRGSIGGVDQAMINFGGDTGASAVYIAANTSGGNPNLLLKAGKHYIRISDSGITMSDNAGGGDTGEPGEDLGFFLWPFSLSLVTSEYGPRTYPYVGFHEGIDFAGGAASEGNPISCAGNGIVAESTFGSGWGNYVRVNHILSSGKRVSTLYAHMIEPSSLSPGDEVRKGQTLGRVGNTGNSFGAHLHFETWNDTEFGSHVNPRDFMALYGPG